MYKSGHCFQITGSARPDPVQTSRCVCGDVLEIQKNKCSLITHGVSSKIRMDMKKRLHCCNRPVLLFLKLSILQKENTHNRHQILMQTEQALHSSRVVEQHPMNWSTRVLRHIHCCLQYKLRKQQHPPHWSIKL